MFLCIVFIKIPTYVSPIYSLTQGHMNESMYWPISYNPTVQVKSFYVSIVILGKKNIHAYCISIIIQVSLCVIWNRKKLKRFVPTIHYGMFVADTKNINKTNERNLPMIHIGYKKSHYWLHRTSIYRDLKCNIGMTFVCA